MVLMLLHMLRLLVLITSTTVLEVNTAAIRAHTQIAVQSLLTLVG